MKKLLAITLVTVSVLGLASGRAFAWPIRHCWCCNKCCNISCTQYNAFSPWCCNCPCPTPSWGPGPSGYYPPLAASFGDNGYANHLPSGTQGGTAPVYVGPAGTPGYNSTPTYTNAPASQPSAVQGTPPGYNPMPSYPTGLIHPSGTPSYYPGAMGYPSPYGAPSYYPGAMGYGPAAGVSR
jgi:hypothetical protein